METTRTSFQPTAVRRAALFDELTKISSAEEDRLRAKKVRRWMKNTLLIAGGTAVGTGVSMAGDRVLRKAVGPKWRKMSTGKRLAILGPAASLATIGSLAAARHLMNTRAKKDRV